MRDDAQYEFGEMGEDGKVVEDYEAGIHPAAVTSDGTLIIAREAALMLLTRAGSDSPATLLRAAGDDVVVFTRDEVYASIGASPEFLHAGFSH